jgi:hypothetical protein
MNNNIIRKLQKYKHPIIISVIVTALSLYALPIEKLFTEVAVAQRATNSGDRPYGNVRQGPPSDTPGQGPPSDTPGRGPPEDRGPPAPRNGPPR